MTIDDTPSLAQRLRGVVLMRGIRQRARAWHRRWVFRKAMAQFKQNPEASFDVNSDVLRRLIYGWGNEAYSPDRHYLAASLLATQAARNPVLECGSGLSTLLAGVVAQRNGNTVWTLEHHPFWAERVRSALRSHGVTAVRVDARPLQKYDGYDWYAPTLDRMPESFDVVLCDGPPGNTRGGRYGCLPIMRERLVSGCTILIDDAERAEELEIANRWARSLGAEFEVRSEGKPYICMRVPA